MTCGVTAASRDRIVSGDRPGSLVLDGSRPADAADGVDLTRQLRHIGDRHDPRASWRLADMPGADLLPDLPFAPRCPPAPDRADLEVRAVLTRLRPLARWLVIRSLASRPSFRRSRSRRISVRVIR